MTLGLKRRCLTCGVLSTGSYCPPHTRPERKAWHGRKYGHAHQELRAQWAIVVATGVIRCSRCGQRIAPSQAWDLDHRPDALAPSHARCNRAAGGRREP
jgi:hypothetical protein